MRRYRQVLGSRRRLTGLEIIGCLIAVALFLLAGFMFAMACWATLSAHMRTEAKITTSQAWTASLVAGVLFSGWINMLLGRLTSRPRR